MHPILISMAARGAFQVAKAVAKSRQAQKAQATGATDGRRVDSTEAAVPNTPLRPVVPTQTASKPSEAEPRPVPPPRPPTRTTFSPPRSNIPPGGVDYNGGWRPGNSPNYNPGRTW